MSLFFRHVSRKEVIGVCVVGEMGVNGPFSFSSPAFPVSCLRNGFSCLSHDGVVASSYLDPMVEAFNGSLQG